MKIAIVGSGISGMAAAYFLSPHHDITVFEKETRIGGHSRTILVKDGAKELAIDTGFIVFNQRNYPNLTRLFDRLEVPTAQSDMSFGVSINNGWLEYGTLRLSDMLAQKRNLFRLEFLRMIYDILRFNRQARAFVGANPHASLGDCLDQLGLSAWFRHYYLLAMAGAIWSSPAGQMAQFPAQALIHFFDNHGLLSLADPIQWYTVRGGAQAYIERLTQPFADKLHPGLGVSRLRRRHDGVELRDTQGQWHRFDHVVLACHSDQALALLDAPEDRERALLSAIAYQPNRVVLHSDDSFMPKRRSAWSSWIYLNETRQDGIPQEALTYWMNNLQPIDSKQNFFVTLNPAREPEQLHNDHVFYHPVFDKAAIEAQTALKGLQGRGGVWYAGAWQGHGFHEDGLVSGMEVARGLGVPMPW